MRSFVSCFLLGCLLATVLACRVQTTPPELSAISPTTAYVGQTVSLTGYQFGNDPVVTFSSGTTVLNGTVSSVSDNQIQATVPLIAPGRATVRVSNGQGSSDPLPITVQQPAPTLLAISPANGLPGTTVTISGQYLNQIRAVRFDQLAAVIQDSTDQKLTLQVPSSLQRGPTFIAIVTGGGQLVIPFIVAAQPTITSLSTRQAKPGTELVIQGTNLGDGVVRINGLATNREQTTTKATEIRTIIPANATSGLVSVTVFDKLVATSTDSLKIVLPPAILGISTAEGIAGDKMQLAGPNLRDISALTFNTVSVPYRVLNDTLIEATLPALGAAGLYTIGVSSVGGSAQSPQSFLYYTAPTNVVPAPVRQLRGQAVTITGTSLYRITEARLNGQLMPITGRVEGTSIQITLPATATSGLITLANRAGTGASSTFLVVVQKPVVTDVIPLKARPGERVVLRGSFLLNAQFFFTGAAAAAADGGKNDDAERWVLVPADAQTGPIRVTNATGESSQTDIFTVIRLVTITDFTPKTAKAGAELTITGQNLSSVTAVKFNGGTLSAPFRLSGSSLLVTVPTGADVGQICLTNDAGTACTSANFTPTK